MVKQKDEGVDEGVTEQSEALLAALTWQGIMSHAQNILLRGGVGGMGWERGGQGELKRADQLERFPFGGGRLG